MEKIESIIKLVCERMNISREALTCKIREGRFAEPKQVCTFLLSRHTPLGSRAIADIIGYNDRSQITYNNKRVTALLRNNKDYRERIRPILREADTILKELRLKEESIFDFYSEAAFEQTATGIIDVEPLKSVA